MSAANLFTATLFTATLGRDLRCALRRPGDLLATPLFFVLAIILFPLALGPDREFLQSAAAGLLALAALLAAFLPLERLFIDDRRDGTLDALLASPSAPALYAAGKLAAQILLAVIPLAVLSPPMGLMLGLTGKTLLLLPAVILVAGILLLLTGALGAALALGTRQGMVLLALLVMPLYIPVLVFAAGAIELARTGEVWHGPFLFLLAMLAVAAPAIPVVCGAVLRLHAR